MGMVFYKGTSRDTGASFPAEYRHDLFVALHGSINRLDLKGYSVVRIPFRDGRPSGPPEDFLTGFILRGRRRQRGVGAAPSTSWSSLTDRSSSRTTPAAGCSGFSYPRQ